MAPKDRFDGSRFSESVALFGRNTHPVGILGLIHYANVILPGVLIDGQSYLSVRDWAAKDRSSPPHWDKTRLTVTLY